MYCEHELAIPSATRVHVIIYNVYTCQQQTYIPTPKHLAVAAREVNRLRIKDRACTHTHLVTAIEYGIFSVAVDNAATQLEKVGAGELDASQRWQTRPNLVQKIFHINY